MRKYVGYLYCALVLVLVPPSATAQETSAPPRALLVADLGSGHDVVAAAMTARGWAISSLEWVKVLPRTGPELRADWDVIWILPGSEYQGLRRLARPGGPLETFAEAGGVVVMTGISTGKPRIDVAVGGIDVMKENNAGATTIDIPTHPLIAGSSRGGSDLTVNDLDPDGTGGGGYILPPATGSPVTAIASNSAGTTLGEYTMGDGHVLISLLGMLDSAPLGNLLAYIESVVSTN